MSQSSEVFDRLNLLVSRSSVLPQLSDLLERLLRLMRSEQTNQAPLRRMISSDRALALSVLRISSCHAFGGCGLPNNLEVAIDRLGTKHLYDLGLALGVHHFIRIMKPRPRFDPSRLCQSGMFVGLLASSLATKGKAFESEKHDPDQILAYALVKDFHIAIMTIVAPNIYDKVAEYGAMRKLTFRAAFTELTGHTTHGIFSSMMKAWGFPPIFGEFASQFEPPVEQFAHDRAMACLLLAEHLANARSFGSDAWTVQTAERNELLPLIGLTPEELEAILKDTENDVVNYLSSFALAA